MTKDIALFARKIDLDQFFQISYIITIDVSLNKSIT